MLPEIFKLNFYSNASLKRLLALTIFDLEPKFKKTDLKAVLYHVFSVVFMFSFSLNDLFLLITKHMKYSLLIRVEKV